MPTLTELSKDSEEMENLMAVYLTCVTGETFEEFIARLKKNTCYPYEDVTLYDWAKNYNAEKESKKQNDANAN